MYATGQGLSQDSEIAFKWYHKAAALGHAKAQYNLAIGLLRGEGTDIDLADAVKWLQKAADQGYAPAQHALGALYAQAKGVPQDYAEAAVFHTSECPPLINPISG